MDAHMAEKEADRRHVGELTRGAALRLWNLQVKKEHRITEPAKFWPMPWDEAPADDAAQQIQALTSEERDKMANDFIKRLDGK